MTQYRRARIPGGTYFFTQALADRQSQLLVEHIEHLRNCIRTVRTQHPFVIDAMVVLPDHLHCLRTLPEQDADFSTRWSLIKSSFSRGIKTGERRSVSRVKRQERGIWQRRFWEHVIRDEADFATHVDYIHFNPVKHGLTEHAVAWPHSSLHRFIRDGRCDAAWSAPDLVTRLDLD